MDDDLVALDDRALEAMVASSQADDGPYRILAGRYFSRGEFHKALHVLDQLLASRPHTDVVAGALHEKATILEWMDQSADAIRCFREILAVVGDAPASPEQLCAAGLSHYRLRSLLPSGSSESHAETARRHLEELVRYDPDYEDEITMSAIGDLRAEQGDFAGAIDAYQRALELGADFEQRHWTQVGLARAYDSTGEFDAAERLYVEASTGAPEHDRSMIRLELGNFLEARGRPVDARAAFESALTAKSESLEPQYLADILWHLAALAYQGSDSDKAREYLEQALPLISDEHLYFADIHIVLGHCCAERGEQAKAREHYNTASFAPLATPEQIEMAQRCLRDIGEVGTA